jgi:hypothetical protein
MAPLTRPKIEFKLILCQAATTDAASGTLNMLGAGWSVTATPTAQQAVALLIKVPWDRANEKLPVLIELRTAGGVAVTLPGPAGPQPLRAEASIEVGRPPGVKAGIALDASLALNFPSLPLPVGRYQWWVDLAGDVQTESFAVVDHR